MDELQGKVDEFFNCDDQELEDGYKNKRRETISRTFKGLEESSSTFWDRSGASNGGGGSGGANGDSVDDEDDDDDEAPHAVALKSAPPKAAVQKPGAGGSSSSASRAKKGFSDYQREHPPAIGSIITLRYQELSDAGAEVPIFCQGKNRCHIIEGQRSGQAGEQPCWLEVWQFCRFACGREPEAGQCLRPAQSLDGLNIKAMAPRFSGRSRSTESR